MTRDAPPPRLPRFARNDRRKKGAGNDRGEGAGNDKGVPRRLGSAPNAAITSFLRDTPAGKYQHYWLIPPNSCLACPSNFSFFDILTNVSKSCLASGTSPNSK